MARITNVSVSNFDQSKETATLVTKGVVLY
jgi:hypothetical protein